MDDPRVSVLIGTSNRPKSLARCVDSILSQKYECIEVIILDNSAYLNTCEEVGEIHESHMVECIHVDEPLGVSGSRNRLIEHASGDILTFIDDDAYFSDDQALDHVVQRFDREVGIQAFRIVHHPEDEEKTRISAPLSKSQRKNQPLDESFKSSYFLGGGHAIRSEVIETCGNYNEDLIYGSEEFDLSFRAIEAGYDIVYNPDIIVYHEPEPPIITREVMGNPELYYKTKNKIYLAYRYLPLRYVPSYILLWMGYYAITALQTLDPFVYSQGIIAGMKMCYSTNRDPVSEGTITYLKSHCGRLWY